VKQRICILTFKGNPIACELFNLLLDGFDVYMIYTRDTNRAISQIWNRKRGLRWFLFNWSFLLGARLYDVGHNPKPSWEELRLNNPGAFIRVEQHNSKIVREKIKALGTDLGVLIGTSLIKPEVYTIPRCGMINLHQGNIPDFRGAPPAYWEHKNKENIMNITVHTVVEKLDAGRILEEKTFSIENHEHFVVSKFYANLLSAPMLISASKKILAGCGGYKREITAGTNTVPKCLPILLDITMLLFGLLKRKYQLNKWG